MARNKRKAVAIVRRRKRRALEAPTTTLGDLVTLLHLQLAPFLAPVDVSRLLRCLSKMLAPDVVHSLATAGLRSLYELKGVHFGRHCVGDWHQLVPEEAEGGEGGCAVCDTAAPNDLPLPRGAARMDLLEAACLADEGFTGACDGVLQMHFGAYAAPRYGSLQPVVFSLATETQDEIDADSVEQLTSLLDSAQMGVGTQFFSNRKRQCAPTNAMEAHWRSIEVDPRTQQARCYYCEYIASHASTHRCERCTEVYSRLLQQHCKALYRPLKVFMTRHLKHVRYVKPCRGWNSGDNEFRGDRMLDLIAGFTPAGVLCGVYLTDLRIPFRLVPERLASGAFET